jgi:S1-C subfamily serine protease
MEQGAKMRSSVTRRWGLLALLGLAFLAVLKLPVTPMSAQEGAEAARRPISTRGALSAREQSTINLFRQAAPSVVYITTAQIRRDVFSLRPLEIPSGAGSGFIWDNKGHVVTNYHVVRGADRARVTLADHSQWSATLVGEAPDKDLAVLRIEASESQLLPLPLGSSSNLQVGQSVLAIGNPFGLDQTLTTGIISALGREIESVSRVPIQDVIQTDAAINPGNSGGPLLDSSGRLIGVNTAIYSPSGVYAGIGFAIPADTVNRVVPDLIAYGRVERAILGVQLASPEVARRFGLEDGALVFQVEKGTGAHAAGLQGFRQSRYGRWYAGDLIVAVENKPVRSTADLFLALEEFSPGDIVRVTVVRDGRSQELSVRLQSSL